MATTAEKYVLAQITSTIQHLTDINNILTEQFKTLMATNTHLKEYGRHQQKQRGQTATRNDHDKNWIQQDIDGLMDKKL